MKFRLLSLCCTILASYAGFAQAPQNVSHTTSRGYLLGPGDVISVKVLLEKDFDFTARVDEDGKIEIPYSETALSVKCRSEKEVTAEIKSHLSKIIREPRVNMMVTEKNSRPPVTINGEIRTPSQVHLTRRATLANILALAQGPTDFASGIVQIKRTTMPVCEEDFGANTWERKPGENVIVRNFSLEALRKGSEEDPVILPGDEINLLRAQAVFINGEVLEPGGRFIKERGLTLTEAIAQVGGLRSEAKRKDIKIYRDKPGATNRDEIIANLDFIATKQAPDVELMPNDIIIVGKTKDSLAMTMFKFAVGLGKTAAISTATGGGYKVMTF